MFFRKKKPQKRERPNIDVQVPKVTPKAKPETKPFVPPEPKKKPARKHDVEKNFIEVFRKLSYRHRAYDIWRDFIVMFACTLSNVTDKFHYEERETRYMKIIQKYNKEERMLFPELLAQTIAALDDNPEQDFLGDIYTKLDLQDEGRQQFFTPYCVCQAMADITMNNVVELVEKQGYITICDPCCGAGATLIAAIHSAKKQLKKTNLNFQNHVLVAAQDIDEIVALMCYIQLSLLGVAAYIKVGNSLSEPMAEGDSLENYWFTLMYFSDIWTTRRQLKRMDSLMKDGGD